MLLRTHEQLRIMLIGAHPITSRVLELLRLLAGWTVCHDVCTSRINFSFVCLSMFAEMLAKFSSLGDQSPLLRPGCHRQLISIFMQCVAWLKLWSPWSSLRSFHFKNSASNDSNDVEDWVSFTSHCIRFLLDNFKFVWGCCLWTSMCHWWHLGQDLCIGQGITSNHWGGAFTVFRNLFVSVVLQWAVSFSRQWKKWQVTERTPVLSSFWQVKDGPDAAFPFRAFRRLRFSNGVWRGDCGDSCWFSSTEAKQDHNGAVCLMKLVNSSGAMGKYFENTIYFDIFSMYFHIFSMYFNTNFLIFAGAKFWGSFVPCHLQMRPLPRLRAIWDIFGLIFLHKEKAFY